MSEERILVPLDGSGESEAAIPYASAIALATGATLRLISVVETEFGYIIDRSAQPSLDWNERQQAQATDYLQRQVDALSDRGIAASSIVRLGDPSDQILREADDIAAMMLITASHGRGGLQRWMLGSVADKLMRLGHRPTLLVRPDGQKASCNVHLELLAIPLDGSPSAEQALRLASELAHSSGAQLLLMRAEPWLTSSIARWGGEGAYIPNLERLEMETTQSIQAYLDGVRGRLPESIQCETAVLRGFTVEELEACCEERHVSLVVMTTHGRGGLSRAVLGSTADRLVRDGIPALLVPPADAARDVDRR